MLQHGRLSRAVTTQADRTCSSACPRPAHASHARCPSTPCRETVTILSRPLAGCTARGNARCAALAVDAPPAIQASESLPTQRPLKVLIAGAGIGGLVLAVALLKKGIQVEVFERDLTAIRGEGKYRGPIQIQSNALAALQAIDEGVATAVLNSGCITGDRINGLCDGVSGDWYVKFDTFHPAVERGLPVTRVISRVELQGILADAAERLGATINGNSRVVSFEEGTDPATGASGVSITLEDGRTASGDVLIGADGIWSKVRLSIVGETEPNYSGYTCYTGISDFTPADIDVVGYRVFLGNGQYFVSSDVGGGKQQWYGFHKEPAGGEDEPGQRKARLLQIFGHWCDNVVDLIKATPEEDVLRRDIYDRPPIFTWHRGRVALLGDSAHAMQPNLGQGGCMAIEDAYQLALGLAGSLETQAGGDPAALDVEGVLAAYQRQRLVRASAIHGMAGMAALMASTYKAHLGEGLGPLSGLTQLRIPHPGRVTGQAVLKLTMPAVLSWVLGGNVGELERARPGSCLLSDKPKAFDESSFEVFMRDDGELLRYTQAHWLLLSERPPTTGVAGGAADATSYVEAKGVAISEQPATVSGGGSSNGNGNDASSAVLVAEGSGVAAEHARVWRDSGSNEAWVQDLGAGAGTWLNGRRLAASEKAALRPQDLLQFGDGGASDSSGGEVFKVKLQHVSVPLGPMSGSEYKLLPCSQLELVALANGGAGKGSATAAQEALEAEAQLQPALLQRLWPFSWGR